MIKKRATTHVSFDTPIVRIGPRLYFNKAFVENVLTKYNYQYVNLYMIEDTEEAEENLFLELTNKKSVYSKQILHKKNTAYANIKTNECNYMELKIFSQTDESVLFKLERYNIRQENKSHYSAYNNNKNYKKQMIPINYKESSIKIEIGNKPVIPKALKDFLIDAKVTYIALEEKENEILIHTTNREEFNLTNKNNRIGSNINLAERNITKMYIFVDNNFFVKKIIPR